MVNEKIEQIRKLLEELQDSSCRFGQNKCEECEFYQPLYNPETNFTCVLGDIENELARLD